MIATETERGRRGGFLSRRDRRGILVVHLASSIGWLGLDAALVVLGIVGLASGDAVTTRSAFVIDGVLATYLMPVFSLLGLLTGIVLAAGTSWGLFKHWWVVVSLVITVLMTAAVLLFLVPQMRGLADQAAHLSDAATLSVMSMDRLKLVIAPLAGFIILVYLTGMNVHKPWGRVGAKRQQAEPEKAASENAVSES
ncbi:MAG TPA: hypothetical protein VG247_28000 [Pseudonocardiaceae bacterium]|nr:hypothetical protein [Pseudonocardiaceae bacterium]